MVKKYLAALTIALFLSNCSKDMVTSPYTVDNVQTFVMINNSASSVEYTGNSNYEAKVSQNDTSFSLSLNCTYSDTIVSYDSYLNNTPRGTLTYGGESSGTTVKAEFWENLFPNSSLSEYYQVTFHTKTNKNLGPFTIHVYRK